MADAVKDLAAHVEESSKQIMETVRALNERVEGLAREIRSQPEGASEGALHSGLRAVEHEVNGIGAAAQRSREICQGLNGQMATIKSEMNDTGRTLDAALGRSETFLSVSEHLIEATANCGVETEDSLYIRGALEAAAELSACLEQVLQSGAASYEDLFDEQYVPKPGTNPQQYQTRFVAVADRFFPLIQEKYLALSPKVVFCIATDRNGYVPTHNRKYCQPQRGDLAWDTANSRYRRIFNDRTGLASGRNEKPFLLQTYRRDMGGGNFIVMKEVASPIRVRGRHWGGVRLAFHF